MKEHEPRVPDIQDESGLRAGLEQHGVSVARELLSNAKYENISDELIHDSVEAMVTSADAAWNCAFLLKTRGEIVHDRVSTEEYNRLVGKAREATEANKPKWIVALESLASQQKKSRSSYFKNLGEPFLSL